MEVLVSLLDELSVETKLDGNATVGSAWLLVFVLDLDVEPWKNLHWAFFT